TMKIKQNLITFLILILIFSSGQFNVLAHDIDEETTEKSLQKEVDNDEMNEEMILQDAESNEHNESNEVAVEENEDDLNEGSLEQDEVLESKDNNNESLNDENEIISKENINLQKVNTNALKRGDRHTKVIQLKMDLNALGFSNFKNPNNLFGVQTEQAIKDFQKFYKLSVDGVAGPATQNK